MAEVLGSSIFSAMQSGTPLKSYRKAILGKVFVTVLNPFNNQPEGRILKGNPKNLTEDNTVDIWSEQEDVFFKRANRSQLQTGNMIEYQKKVVIDKTEEEVANTISDEELQKVISGPYLKFQTLVNKMTTEAPLFRTLTMAKELERSEKYINLIEARISEVQEIKVKE